MFYDHTGNITSMEKEYNNRSAVTVAAKIMCELPESEEKFKDDLLNFVIKKAYSSPELCKSKEFWLQLEKIMHTHIPIPKTVLQKKIVNIYTGFLDA